MRPRVRSMEREETNEVLDYVMRSLDVLDETAPPPHPRRKLIGTVLKWLETAKCGSSAEILIRTHGLIGQFGDIFVYMQRRERGTATFLRYSLL